MKRNGPIMMLLALMSAFLVSCDKDYLEKINDKALLVPATISDFQALLDDNNNVMNLTPFLGEVSSDNFYTTNPGYLAWFTELERNAFTWSADPNATGTVTDWNTGYKQIFNANIVLEGLPNVQGAASATDLRQLRGSALFYRGYALYNLAQIFASQYDPATAGSQPGVPVRLSADVNLRPGRGTVDETYQQVIKDMKEAADLLPGTVAYKTRPSQSAAFALLARIYLSMGQHEEALSYANKALQIQSSLLDYNTLNLTAARAFPVLLPNANAEVIYYSRMPGTSLFSSALTFVDSLLYRSYDANDLRKTVFFQNRGGGNYSFRGSYTGRTELFSGLANDELYLIRAECLARNGEHQGAISNLNTLLSKRWKTGTYVSMTASTADEALGIVLRERRKELLIRGLRWSDLKRLNPDARFAVTLKRSLNSQNFSLTPQDKRYVLLIPTEEITATGIAQNPR